MNLHEIKTKDLVIHTCPMGSLQCNCSIIYNNQTKDAIIIDPGNDAEKLLTIITEKNLKVHSLIHTHAHFDHIGHSNRLRDILGCKIFLHQDDLFLYNILEQQGMMFGEQVDIPKPVDGYIEDQQEFFLEKNKIISTIFTPGHTPGSCSFYSENFDLPVLFSGDTLFKKSIGRTDLPGGDSQKIIKSIKQKILTLPEETICIPGHGDLTTVKQEKNANPFI
jgi:hydroxyacylglutathione hydrolase